MECERAGERTDVRHDGGGGSWEDPDPDLRELAEIESRRQDREASGDGGAASDSLQPTRPWEHSLWELVLTFTLTFRVPLVILGLALLAILHRAFLQ